MHFKRRGRLKTKDMQFAMCHFDKRGPDRKRASHVVGSIPSILQTSAAGGAASVKRTEEHSRYLSSPKCDPMPPPPPPPPQTELCLVKMTATAARHAPTKLNNLLRLTKVLLIFLNRLGENFPPLNSAKSNYPC